MVQAWLDNTGLYQKYGVDQTTPMAGGEYRSNGETREIEFKITLADLGSSAAIIEGTDNLVMPAGFTVETVEVIADTAAVASGGSATLDIGLIRYDRSTEIDYNGLVAAMAKTAIDTTGEKNILNKGSTGAGALVGTTVGSNPGYFTANYGTAAFDSGVVTVRVKFRKP